jgi:hypothetical protein
MELRNSISRVAQRLQALREFEEQVLDDPEIEEVWLQTMRLDYSPAVRGRAA